MAGAHLLGPLRTEHRRLDPPGNLRPRAGPPTTPTGPTNPRASMAAPTDRSLAMEGPGQCETALPDGQQQRRRRTADGWFIDDLDVSENPNRNTPLMLPFTDDFESGRHRLAALVLERPAGRCGRRWRGGLARGGPTTAGWHPTPSNGRCSTGRDAAARLERAGHLLGARQLWATTATSGCITPPMAVSVGPNSPTSGAILVSTPTASLATLPGESPRWPPLAAQTCGCGSPPTCDYRARC